MARTISTGLDISGRKYGRLTAIRLYQRGTDNKVDWRKNITWLFNCDCGSEMEFVKSDVVNGHSTSCGCVQRKNSAKAHYKHGHSPWGQSATRIYRIWQGIQKRTSNPKEPSYKYYGARGIKCCERWKDFRNFLDDMGLSYEEHLQKFGAKNTSIDRIDNYQGYELSNCRWATAKEQANNKRAK